MTEQLISFETAKLAKEKGFNVPTQSFWYRLVDKEGNQLHCSPHHMIDDKLYVYVVEQEHMDNLCICSTPIGAENTELDTFYLAPTQSLLQKWLREIHDIHVNLSYNLYLYDVDIIDCNDGENITLISSLTDVTPYKFTVYEDALETGLYKALELIKLPA